MSIIYNTQIFSSILRYIRKTLKDPQMLIKSYLSQQKFHLERD